MLKHSFIGRPIISEVHTTPPAATEHQSTIDIDTLWPDFLAYMHQKAGSEFPMYITPLQPKIEGKKLTLFAPNDFVFDAIKTNHQQAIEHFFQPMVDQGKLSGLHIEIGSSTEVSSNSETTPSPTLSNTNSVAHTSFLNPNFTFDAFVAGKSNQLARAAAEKASTELGAYNPLLIYGGVGLGKTHLMHAIGNQILSKNPNAKILYQSSEGFVAHMVKALQMNAIDKFKTKYRSLHALLIDDIQFFAGKERSQEEFFHTFNILFDKGQQIILTCDRYPKEIKGLEDRLKSRFGWGLAVSVEPPDLETRVAILMNKAEQAKVKLPDDVAFFIATHVKSNVRELEGALKRLIANAHFTGGVIDIDFAKEALKDLIAIYTKLISIDSIQKTVANFYKIKIEELLSKKRVRAIARPRQMAMHLCKSMTSSSLPEIGKAFGGRDHTTVLHAHRLMIELIEQDPIIKEDYNTLTRILSA